MEMLWEGKGQAALVDLFHPTSSQEDHALEGLSIFQRTSCDSWADFGVYHLSLKCAGTVNENSQQQSSSVANISLLLCQACTGTLATRLDRNLGAHMAY